MIRQTLSRFVPSAVLRRAATPRACARLAFCYGHARSAAIGRPVTATGEPCPWLTFPAIEFLIQLDWSEVSAIEFGSGNSTRFWSERVHDLIAVEHDPAWHEQISAELGGPVDYRLAEDLDSYVGALSGRSFGLIIIDGIHRAQCVEASVSSLGVGGVIVLDNSERHPNECEQLRNAGLLQVDFSGFGPINHYTWVTSVFFDRRADLRPIREQPLHPIAGEFER